MVASIIIYVSLSLSVHMSYNINIHNMYTRVSIDMPANKESTYDILSLSPHSRIGLASADTMSWLWPGLVLKNDMLK